MHAVVLGGDSQYPVARAGLVGRLADAASLKLENSVARLIGQQNLVQTVLHDRIHQRRAVKRRPVPDIFDDRAYESELGRNQLPPCMRDVT